MREIEWDREAGRGPQSGEINRDSSRWAAAQPATNFGWEVCVRRSRALVNKSVRSCPLDQGAARINPLAGESDAELPHTLPPQSRCRAVSVHACVRRTCMHAADCGAAVRPLKKKKKKRGRSIF